MTPILVFELWKESRVLYICLWRSIGFYFQYLVKSPQKAYIHLLHFKKRAEYDLSVQQVQSMDVSTKGQVYLALAAQTS